ncbi:hypothetical protein [Nostoc sp.]
MIIRNGGFVIPVTNFATAAHQEKSALWVDGKGLNLKLIYA